MAIKNHDFQHHIRLILDNKLSNNEINEFVDIVKRTGPDNIIKPVEIYDEIDKTKSIEMKVKKKNNKYWYVIPLMRDLTEKEAEKIVITWSQVFEDDFLLETSTPYTGEEVEPECLTCEHDYYVGNHDLIEFHNLWIRQLLEHGWRYGIQFSKKDKTHPLLLPWEQIPRSFKEHAYSDILLKILEN